LIKDYIFGDFDTSEIERCWNVSVLHTKRKLFGWGFSKFEVLFLRNNERVLIVDSDTVFLGGVIETLEIFDEDFIVAGHTIDNPRLRLIKKFYFDIDKLLDLDPNYIFPGRCFNSGQIVATCGKINRRDFSPLIAWRQPPVFKCKDVFGYGEQGILNYVLATKEQRGEVSIKYFHFMHWSEDKSHRRFFLSKIKKRQGYPLIIHWAGAKGRIISKMKYATILKFYDDVYHTSVKS
jgi:lipopolysaccharide biosynthesis glycosyltransferase